MTVYQSRKGEESLNAVINDVLNDVINLKKETTKKARAIVTELLNSYLIPTMKNEDVSFNAIYERNFYAGSFYDGLKVGEPNEFDLNIVLKFPVSETDLQVYDRWSDEGKRMDVLPGHAFYCSNKAPAELFHPNHQRYNDWRRLSTFFVYQEGVYHLSPSGVKKWFQGVVERALNVIGRSGLRIGQECVYISPSRAAGPAWTLNIKTNSSMEMDIDLVPVFYFEDSKEGTVYVVPKPPESDDLQWRLSYADKERRILYSNSCAKKAIKLLKRLRDMQGAPWKKLCSYHLKNFVIREMDSYTWNEKELGVIFLGLLNKLQQYLTDEEMPSNFDKTHNIILNIGDKTLENIKNRLARIIADIERNPPINMRKYFIKPEQVAWKSYSYKAQGRSVSSMQSAEHDDHELSPRMKDSRIPNWVIGAGVAAVVTVGIAGLVSWAANREDQDKRKKK